MFHVVSGIIRFAAVMLGEKKVDLMIVGAQKAGTTSLIRYLAQHPRLITHPQVEFSFFASDTEFGQGWDKAFQKLEVPPQADPAMKVAVKCVAVCNNEVALQRLRDHHAACLIVFVVRHPAERAWSSYSMERSSGWMSKDFNMISQSILKFRQGEKDQMFRLFIELGMYASHLKKIYTCFPKEQVRVYSFDDLRQDPLRICNQLFQWLGLDETAELDLSVKYNETFLPRSAAVSKALIRLSSEENAMKKLAKRILPPSWFVKSSEFLLKLNSSKNRSPKLTGPVRKELVEFFKPYNKEFAELTGMEVASWNQ